MHLTAVAVVPHAPLLLGGIGPADPTRAALREAAGSLAFDGDVLVLLSPHGSRAGVYVGAAGSLDGAGIPGHEISAPVAREVVGALSEAWGVAELDEPLDHAAVVALSLIEPKVPVVVACLSEISRPDGAPARRAIDEGTAFAKALRDLDAEGRVSFVATAHTGAALADRGPLGKRWSALELEEHVRKAFEAEPSRLPSLAFDLWLEAGSCSSGVLAAIGEVAAGPGVIRAYDASIGVGYVVAELPA